MKTNDKVSYEIAQQLTGIPMGTMYAMVSRKQIPYYRLGPRLVVFSRAELERWLEQRHVSPDVRSHRGTSKRATRLRGTQD